MKSNITSRYLGKIIYSIQNNNGFLLTLVRKNIGISDVWHTRLVRVQECIIQNQYWCL